MSHKYSFPQKINFLLRADSGFELGFGHRIRVEVIAKYLKSLGYDYRIISQQIPGARNINLDIYSTLWMKKINENISQNNTEISDALESIKLCNDNNFKVDIVIVDSYQLGKIWEKKMRDDGYFVVSLDDFKDRDHDSNLVIRLIPAKYKKNYISGLEFFPVDSSFESNVKNFKQIDWRILVTFGADPSGHTKIAVEALIEVINENPMLISHVDVVINTNEDVSEKLPLYSLPPAKFTFHRNLSSLSTLMKECDLVITSGGNTSIEAIVSRRPAIVIITAENQKLASNYLNSKGLIYLLGLSNKIGIKEIKNSLYDITTKINSGMLYNIQNSNININGASKIIDAILTRWKFKTNESKN